MIGHNSWLIMRTICYAALHHPGGTSFAPCSAFAKQFYEGSDKVTLSSNAYFVEGLRTSVRGWLSQVPAWIQFWRGRWVARRARGRELRELYNCSDRELRDIGLSRSDFLAIEKGVYRQS